MADPGGLLGTIVAHKRLEVAARLGGAAIEAQPTRLSLAAALAGPGARFIMEVKRASPSAGTIRPGADPAALSAAFAGPASAMSVLTDGPFFGGSLEDLAQVRRAFAGPVLAKDFIVDPRQVAEARLYGADAVLLLLSVLNDAEAAAVMREAESLGMDVLVEVRDEKEVRRALSLGAPMIGINNRDLRTLEIDLSTTEQLAPLVPADRLVVVESGVQDRGDVERLAPYADAFLVGTALMRADDPAEAARTLAFGRVKICGVTNAADLDMVAQAGATHAGFVMVPGTPRAVTQAAVDAILDAARAKVRLAGIFRNETPQHVNMAARRLGLDAVQLHGHEEVGAYRAILPEETEIWAAVQVGAGQVGPRTGADRMLFDSGSGGTGHTFDWSRIEGWDELRYGLLAGGLNPANASAAARLGAWALDVGSGLEAASGWKDPRRTTAFFEALRPPARRDFLQC